MGEPHGPEALVSLQSLRLHVYAAAGAGVGSPAGIPLRGLPGRTHGAHPMPEERLRRDARPDRRSIPRLSALTPPVRPRAAKTACSTARAGLYCPALNFFLAPERQA